MLRRLAPSPHLDPVLEVAGPQQAVQVTPNSYRSWTEMFDDNTDKSDILLTSGNYGSWGPCNLPAGGSLDRRRVLRFEDYEVRPWNRVGREALTGPVIAAPGSCDWIVHGLTLRGPAAGPAVTQTGSERISFDAMLIEDFSNYGVRLRGDHGTIQNSLIRRAGKGLDGLGVQLRVHEQPNIGNRVIDCEIYDCADSIQITWDNRDGYRHLPCSGAIIDGNDMYITLDRYQKLDGTYADAENGIDVKAGPDEPGTPIVFSNNRIWGFRRTAPNVDGPSSLGAAVTIHRRARNLLFERNVVFDVPLAFQEVRHDVDDRPDRRRGVELRDNTIVGIGRYQPADLSAILRTKQGFVLVGNHFASAGTLSAEPKLTVDGVELVDEFRDNTIYDVPLGEAEGDWSANHEPDGVLDDLFLERRRWSGPDFVHLSNAFHTGHGDSSGSV